MAGRQAILLRVGALAALLAAAAGCFDYAEQLRVSPSGRADATVRYTLPPFMHPLAESGFLFPVSAPVLAAKLPAAKPRLDAKGGLLGFTLAGAALADLDTRLVTRRYTVDGDGNYTFTIRVTPPPGFAADVSAAVRRHLQKIPFLGAAKTAVVRADVLKHMGPSFTVEFASPVTFTNGNKRDHTVAWKIPIARFLKDEPIVLMAAGRLSFWQRLRNALRL